MQHRPLGNLVQTGADIFGYTLETQSLERIDPAELRHIMKFDIGVNHRFRISRNSMNRQLSSRQYSNWPSPHANL